MFNLELKIPPLLLVIFFGILMRLIALVFPLVNLAPKVTYIIAITALATSLYFSMSGVLAFKKVKTTVNPMTPEESSSLVTSGIYKITRNPMYVGFLFLLITWAAYLSSLYALGAVVLFVIYMNKFQIKPEEKMLTSIFGDEFSHYKSNVRRWL